MIVFLGGDLKDIFASILLMPRSSMHILFIVIISGIVVYVLARAYRELGQLRKMVEKHKHNESKQAQELVNLHSLVVSKDSIIQKAEKAFTHSAEESQKRMELVQNQFDLLKVRDDIVTEHSATGILEIDRDLNIIYANQRVRRILGVPSRKIPYIVGYNIRTFPLFQGTDIIIGMASLYKNRKIAIDVEIKDNLERKRVLHIESYNLNMKEKFTGAYLLISDVTSQIRAEEKLHQAIIMQKSSLDDMISTIIAISGVRDPYTAGHQKRVSELAVAIGKEMKLDAHMLHGIEITAKIHDIGKVAVPSEILTRPGKITEMEYSVIKQHCDVGYNILKNIKSQWPIADIVRQHHEHLDGTGYPLGLKGDEICMESRVITVADIVEAINSHRPYRPSLGIDVAMKAINEFKGVRYDAEVVEACERVVAQGFTFSKAF